MQTFNSAKKLIAVCDKSGNTIKILKKIMKFCSRENYSIVSSEEPPPENAQPSVLLLSDIDKNPNINKFPVCVASYDFSAVPEVSKLKPVTYSILSDEADFTAKNIRKIKNGYLAFEIIGVGVIGRVRLKAENIDESDGEKIVNAALAAASAAISFGISFAEVLNALNNIQIDN